jgi:hypothetical protein
MILVMHTNTPNQSVERTATRRLFIIQMIKAVLVRAKLPSLGAAELVLVRPHASKAAFIAVSSILQTRFLSYLKLSVRSLHFVREIA